MWHEVKKATEHKVGSTNGACKRGSEKPSHAAAEHRKETCWGVVVGNVVSYKLVTVTTSRLLLFWINLNHCSVRLGHRCLVFLSSLLQTHRQIRPKKTVRDTDDEAQSSKHTLLPISLCHCVTYLHSHLVSHWCEAVSLCQSFVLCWRKHRVEASK